MTTMPTAELVDECDGADRPADTYTLDELVAATGATAKQVDHWTRGGYLHPIARENATSGVRRRWPASERDACAHMVRLVDVGLSLDLAHTVARHPGPGPYRDRGVRISITPDHERQQQEAEAAVEREVLRYLGRAAVATLLRRTLGEATAAAEILVEDDGRPQLTRPGFQPAPRPDVQQWPVAGLILSAHLLTSCNWIPAQDPE